MNYKEHSGAFIANKGHTKKTGGYRNFVGLTHTLQMEPKARQKTDQINLPTVTEQDEGESRIYQKRTSCGKGREEVGNTNWANILLKKPSLAFWKYSSIEVLKTINIKSDRPSPEEPK